MQQQSPPTIAGVAEAIPGYYRYELPARALAQKGMLGPRPLGVVGGATEPELPPADILVLCQNLRFWYEDAARRQRARGALLVADADDDLMVVTARELLGPVHDDARHWPLPPIGDETAADWGAHVILSTVPCVASPIPAYQEWRGRPGTGAIVLPDNEPESWLAALRRLIEHSSLRKRMGREARACAEARSIDHWAPKWMEAYTEAGRRLGLEWAA